MLLYKRQFNSWHIAAPFLTLWLISPAIADWMNSHRRENRNPRLSGQDRRFLRQIACQTWRFFDDLVGPSTHWLPPDNSQESLRIEVAQRTSPTNIGLWLLSALGACDLGYITRDQMVDRTHRTLETMAALERFEGHLLNWYDIQTLQPLRPPYVSTVDSGNLLACLWILEQGYHDCVVRPLIGPESLHALADRLELLCAAMDREDQKDQTIRHALEVLNQLLQNPPDELEEIIGRVRRAASPVERLTQSLHLRLPPEDERVYLATKLMEGVVACTSIIDRYLHWFEILVDLPEDICSKIDRNLLKQVSLEMLVSDKVSSCILKASSVRFELLK